MNRYTGQADFEHGAETAVGVLLVNLGTPRAPTPRALRAYLKEFLSDPRVVEFPRWAWWLILNGVILNIRPRRSAEAYSKIWTPQGSPLLTMSERLTGALAQSLERTVAGPVRVGLAMRYGEPSVSSVLSDLQAAGARRLLVLPLYPQYSGSTVGSVFDAVADHFKGSRWLPALRFIDAYHDDPRYIDALAHSIVGYWDEHGRGQRLLMSFHGVPRRYLMAGDPYHCQCHKTARLVAERLGLEAADWMIVFQSRFGREEWLRPYCDETLGQLPEQGIKSVDVVCPGFAVDCLETLEEIDQQNRELFVAAGGERFAYIPCLNDRAEHVEALTRIVIDNLGGWPGVEDWNRQRERAEREASFRRASALREATGGTQT